MVHAAKDVDVVIEFADGTVILFGRSNLEDAKSELKRRFGSETYRFSFEYYGESGKCPRGKDFILRLRRAADRIEQVDANQTA